MGIVGLGVGAAHADGFNRLPDDYEVVVVADPTPAGSSSCRASPRPRGRRACKTCSPAMTSTRSASPRRPSCTSTRCPPSSGPASTHLREAAGRVPGHVDELADVESETGRWVMPIFQYRYGRGLQRLLHLIDAGVTGRCHTVSVDVSWRRPPEYYDVSWRGRHATELGGTLLSHCVHALDMVTSPWGSR